MYIYYFLGYNLKQWQLSKTNMTDEVYYLRTDSTFLLALDGDNDFKPSAVTMLVDLMKRDLRVGAACGRIHPTGSGKNNSTACRLLELFSGFVQLGERQ